MSDRNVIISKNDLLLIAALAAAALIAAVILHFAAGNTCRYAKLTYGDGLEEMIDLSRNGLYEYESNGYGLHIEVKDGTAAFVGSECPDHICEGYGRLSHEGDTAICLPAKAALTVTQ